MMNPVISNEDYKKQLQQKIEKINAQFFEFNLPNLDIYPSPIGHFRHRVEFRIWHDHDDLYYAMFDKAVPNKVVRIDDFKIASRAINELMPILLEKIKQDDELKHKLFQVEFLNSQLGEMLVTLIYHKKLDESWQISAQKLADTLDIKLIGRSRGQKLVLTNDYVIEKLCIKPNNQPLSFFYQQIEGAFSQPNPFVCEDMLTFACECAKTIPTKKDLLELYCGNGNFTLPLSLFFDKVLATEVAKSSVLATKWAIKQNNIDNIAIARLSAEEFAQAYQKQRQFRRLLQEGICIDDYQFSTIFVDPPRAGIDDKTLKIMSEFDYIIYISCNPDTLLDNLQQLVGTHTIERFALFDQFAYTPHIECGVFLSKRS